MNINPVKRDKDDYKVIFGCAAISKTEANKLGMALIIGLAGAILAFFLFGVQNKTIIFFISVALAGFGNFVIANKVFR